MGAICSDSDRIYNEKQKCSILSEERCHTYSYNYEESSIDKSSNVSDFYEYRDMCLLVSNISKDNPDIRIEFIKQIKEGALHVTK